VDDEESVRSLGNRMLERLGFKVLIAVDGQQALEIFRERTTRSCW
jgi:two-component system cell cycle sensor histidine kinase/response regulator CckA